MNRPPRLRFPKIAHLSESSEFLRVRTKGEAVHGKLMVLGVLKGVNDGPARIGLVTSRKVGGAVVRNRVRRKLREIVRMVRGAIPSGTWLVIVAKTRAATASSDLLCQEWTTLARRAGVLP